MTIEEIITHMSGVDIADRHKYDDEALVEDWGDWYRGKAAFHSYTIYTGNGSVKMERMSLQMPKRACEDWANLLLNEKTDVVLTDEKSNENLITLFENTKFWTKSNGAVEKSFALGEGALVATVTVELDKNGKNTQNGAIDILFFTRNRMYPISFKNGKIVECAFVQVEGNTTKIAVHKIGEDGLYEIINGVASGKDLKSLEYNEKFEYTFNTGSKYPIFMEIRPNIQNNIDIDSPFGISIFANALDIAKGIDISYDSEVNEFSLGRKRIFVSAATDVKVDPTTGQQKKVFDSNDVVFYQLPTGLDGKNFIEDSTQALRIDEHEKGIQANLNRFSAAVGFGNNRYRYDQGSVATATQVISENSDMFRNIQKHETLIRDGLTTFVRALMRLSNEFTPLKFNEESKINVIFDDSIIEDKEAQKASDRQDVSQGLMAHWEYRMRHYGENEETAKKMADEIDATHIPDGEF